MNYITKLVCSAALSGLISWPSLAADQPVFPERQPFSGIFPLVQGVGTVTVAGEGIWVRTTYQDGERPYLSPYDDSGQILPDGRYRFEYRSTPQTSESVGTSLAASTNSAVEVLHGQFRVSGAEIIFD